MQHENKPVRSRFIICQPKRLSGSDMASTGMFSRPRTIYQPLALVAGLMTTSFRGMAVELMPESESSPDAQLNIAETLEASRRNFALSIQTSLVDSVRFIDSPSSAKQCDSPITMYCNGNCRSDSHWAALDSKPRANVVSRDFCYLTFWPNYSIDLPRFLGR